MTNITFEPNEVPSPSISDTFLVRLPLYLYNKSLGKALNKQTPEHIAWEAEGEDVASTDALNIALSANANGETRKRRAKAQQ